MTQTRKKLVFSWVLILAMVISVIIPGNGLAVKAEGTNISTLSDSYADKLAAVTKYLKDNLQIDGNNYSYGYEWRIMQQARNGESSDADKMIYHTYYDSVVNMINKGDAKFTTNSYATITIALTAIGADPTNVGGKNLLKGFSDYSVLSSEPYASSLVYALIAVDTGKYEIPDADNGNTTTKDKLVELLVSKLDSETGLSGYEYNGFFYEDIDTTGMIIQALAPYYNSNSKVKSIIDKSLATLSSKQGDDGSFSSYDSVCTTAQMLCALVALGINPENDSRFIKNGNSTLDYILSNYDVKTGAIAPSGAYDVLYTSDQAAYALTAYDRYVKSSNGLYDMSDVKRPIYHYGGKATCTKKAVCQVCGTEYGEFDPENHTGNTSIKNAKESTFTEKGYTGDKVCDDCGVVLEKGVELPLKEIVNKEYKLPAAGEAASSVEYTGAADQVETSVTIQNVVKDSSGKEYAVTKVADGAFANNKKLTDVTIGANVTTIGADAFKNCTKLSEVIIQDDSVTTVSAGAFSGAKALTEIDFSECKLQTIDKNAFSGCKKLKDIKLNGNKLTKVGKNAFKNVKKNAKFTIYAKNKKTYKKVVKLIKKSGAKKVKFTYKKKK